MRVNLWLALSTTAIAEFTARRDNQDYSGPMDDQTFKILSRMADADVVRGMFKNVVAGGKTYRLFSLNFDASQTARDAVEKIVADWPQHVLVIGAWWFDGRQVGTHFDDEGNITGTPLYPIHAQAWRAMPDRVTYDAQGNVTATIQATSNADLRDINLVDDQSPRRFV